MPITAELTKDFRFEAAHFLPKVPSSHNCHRIHGHSYRVTVRIKGEINEELGWVMDLGIISEQFKELQAELDNTLLNDIEGLSNPTSENLGLWVLKRLMPRLPNISSVTVYATALVSVTIQAADLHIK